MPFVVNHWGTSEAVLLDGRLVGLVPVGSDADPSPISPGALAANDHAVRICRPAVRQGFLARRERGSPIEGDAPRRRGGEPFVEVPWDEALDLVTQQLQRVRAEHGNEAIFAGSYGWASAGRFHNPQAQLFRFLDLIGGFTRSVNSYSYGAAEVILPHVAGSFFSVLAAHTSWAELVKAGRLVVAFGGLAAKNQQVENGGTYRHLAPEGIRAAHRAGVRFINVSPLRSDTAPEIEADWLAIRPGTDLALILALCHTLVAEGLHDEAFLDRYCHGADRFVASLAGHDAAWAEGITGLAAGRIRALARDLAAGPTLVNVSWSLQRAEHGEHVYWGAIALACLLGQLGRPGGGFGLGYGSVNRVGSGQRSWSLDRIRVGHNPVSAYIPVARIIELLENPGGRLAYDGQELDLPDIRLVYWCGGNPFHHHQDLNRLVSAWQRPECVIVHEQTWNPLARHGDIVLPATTTLERNDLASAPGTGAVVAMTRLVDPVGEAWDDHVIFAALARRFGCEEAFTEGLDVDGWLRRLWSQAQGQSGPAGRELPSFEQLQADGVLTLPLPAQPAVLFESFRRDPDANPLPTPSGRIELFSDILDALAIPGVPSLAIWQEPVEWLGAPLAQRFPLHLLTNQPTFRLHSQLDHAALSLASKVQGREPISLNPIDAAARGLQAGSVVRVFNDRGACLAGVVVSEEVLPGVVVMAVGAWFDPLVGGVPGSLCVHGNPNVLTSARPASALSQGCAAQSCLVDIELWRDPLPPVKAHEPPQFVLHAG